MKTRTHRRLLGLTAAVLVAACSGGSDRPDTAVTPGADTAPAARPPGGMAGMPGMQGMSAGMMEQMQAHMRTMEGAAPDSLRAMLPMHRQMVANMIAQFDREMRGMNMQGDTAWQALLDSLRQDNIRMPRMSAGELQAFMPAHRARIMRLMSRHRSMMDSMRP